MKQIHIRIGRSRNGAYIVQTIDETAATDDTEVHVYTSVDEVIDHVRGLVPHLDNT